MLPYKNQHKTFPTPASYLLDAEWLEKFQAQAPSSLRDEFLAAEATFFRYHEPTSRLVVAAWTYEPYGLKLYTVDLASFKLDLLHEISGKETYKRWTHLDLSADGRFIVAAYLHSPPQGHSAGITFQIWDGCDLRFEESDPVIPLRYREDNETYQFFCTLHPDNRHCTFWMYAEQKLRMIDMQTGQVVAMKGEVELDALGISPDGTRLLVNEWNQLNVCRWPKWKVEHFLSHEMGYYYWGATAIGINASGDLAVAFSANERTSYRDINMDVTDFDSHLIMWQLQANGTWLTKEVVHFGKWQIGGHDSVSIVTVGDAIHWAGVIDDTQILVVAFPTLQQHILDAELGPSSKVWLSADARRVYCGDTVLELRWYDLPF